MVGRRRHKKTSKKSMLELHIAHCSVCAAAPAARQIDRHRNENLCFSCVVLFPKAGIRFFFSTVVFGGFHYARARCSYHITHSTILKLSSLWWSVAEKYLLVFIAVFSFGYVVVHILTEAKERAEFDRFFCFWLVCVHLSVCLGIWLNSRWR